MFDGYGVASREECRNSRRSRPGEAVEHDVSGIGENLDEPCDGLKRLLGRMRGDLASVLANLIRNDGLHAVLAEEVEGFWSPELSPVVDEPHAVLHAATKAVLLDVRKRIFLLKNERLAIGEEAASFQLVGNPRCVAVAEEQHHAPLRREDTLVL